MCKSLHFRKLVLTLSQVNEEVSFSASAGFGNPEQID